MFRIVIRCDSVSHFQQRLSLNRDSLTKLTEGIFSPGKTNRTTQKMVYFKSGTQRALLWVKWKIFVSQKKITVRINNALPLNNYCKTKKIFLYVVLYKFTKFSKKKSINYFLSEYYNVQNIPYLFINLFDAIVMIVQ